MRMFMCGAGEVMREWRILLHGGLYDLYFSPNVIRVIKSGRMRLVKIQVGE
jgi:hypothetical protein